MESWKKYQRQKRSNTHVQRLVQIIIALVVLLVILAIGRGLFWFYSGSNRNSYSYFESITWNSDQQLNLLVGDSMLLGLDPVLKEIKVVHLEESLRGDELQLFTKQNYVVFDAYISNEQSVKTIEDAKGYVRSAIYNDEFQTNITRYQLYKVWRFLSKDENTQNEQDSIMLPESVVREEDLKIRILNGTTIPGLANEQAVWVENLGASVIEVGNAEQTFEKTKIISYVEDDNYQTLSRLEDIYETEVDYRPSDQLQRVEVDVIIGKDVLLK